MSKKKTSKKVSLQDFLTEKTTKSWGEREEDSTPAKIEPKVETKPETNVEQKVEQKEQPKEQPKQFKEQPKEQPKRTFQPVDESKIPKEPPFVAYFGNLSFKIIEDDIALLIGEEGIESINIPLDREKGKPKGFAYVEFSNVDALKNALKFNGSYFFDRQIRVDVSEQKQKPNFHRDESFQSYRKERTNRYDRDQNTSRFDTSRYEKTESKSDTEEKWSRKTKQQPKPKDFSSGSSTFSSSNKSSNVYSSSEKPFEKKKKESTDLFGEGKPWEPKDDIEKKIEERLQREKEERRKRLEETSSSGFKKKIIIKI